MDMKKIIKAVLFTPTIRGWGLQLALVASPGTSKTSQIKQIAKSCGMHCEILSPGERGEGAFGVVPVPENNVLTYPPPEWAQYFMEQKRGIVFVDELTTAPPALQPPLLGLFLEGRIGGHALPPGVRTIAAYNAVEEAAAGYDLPPPLANRMGHLPFNAGTVENWIDWLIENEVGDEVSETLKPEDEEKRVLAAWPEEFAKAKGKIAAFVKRRPELLHKMPAAHDPKASGAWPSRRTWEMVTRAMATSTIHLLDENEEIALLSSYVGEPVIGELFTFLNEHDLPDPVAILEGKEEFEHNAKRLDRTYAVLSACTALVIPEGAKNRDARAKKLWTILAGIAGKGAQDIVFGPARRMAQAGHLKHKEARPVLTKMNKVMTAAGIKGS